VTGLAADLEFRGLIHQVSDPSLLARLDAGGLSAYIGFDPSQPSLQFGNLMQLCLLRRLQLAGHRPIVLLGGGTGMIGDPGGRSDERNLLGPTELAANVAGIRPQLEAFLDFTDAAGQCRALLLDNSDWLGSIRLVEFLRDVGKHFTVNQMVAKESVRSRLERPDQGISYTEFSYMLLQAYDFLRLYEDQGCQLQIGGSDQWGNIVMGVELIGRAAHGEAFAMTTPLATRPDGTKFGKSVSGALWLDPKRTSPYLLYQFLVNTADAVVDDYLCYFTFLDRDEIIELREDTAGHPERRSAQRRLAHEVCTMVHGADETARAERASQALFGEEIASLDESTLLAVVDDAPSSAISRASLVDGLSVVDALVASELAKSKAEARRLIGSNSVCVNNRLVDGDDRRLGVADLLHDRYIVLRKGRRSFHLLRVE
jgi:tyrosyl-tRNA synthetase